MTRSLGDFELKKVGVSSIPSISKIDFPSQKFFILLASDGIWDCWKYKELEEIFRDKIKSDNFRHLHSQRSKELFGSNVDDAILYFINIL